MPPSKKIPTKPSNEANLGFEAKLWAAADAHSRTGAAADPGVDVHALGGAPAL